MVHRRTRHRTRKSEITAHHLNLPRKSSRFGIAHQCADLCARGYELRENLTAHVAGCASDQNAIHPSIFLGGCLYRFRAVGDSEAICTED
jgi:hypothetical protein